MMHLRHEEFLFSSREEIKMMFDYANRHEMQIAIHAIGDGIFNWIFEGSENVVKKLFS